MRWLRRLLFAFVPLLLTLFLAWYIAVATKRIAPYREQGHAPREDLSRWFPREKHGLNHVFLEGSAFQRGADFGRRTKELLEKQEDALVARFDEVFPRAIFQRLFILFAKTWFFDVDPYIKEEWRDEMHGVSLSAPKKYDYLADGYTRQLAYHGLHEAGQAFVDYGDDSFGCTVLAVPKGKNWLLGRNFDFEGGRIFDEEKILKWVKPAEGIPFVSVTWAGMVGAVTGVNREGVYVSLNAAGSRDFSRLGTPTSLLVLEALQHAKSAREAVELIRMAQTVIAEIFVVAGPGSPLFVVEKSPTRTVVKEHQQAVAVANHLLAPEWKEDSINAYRREELTSAARLKRGTAIVKELAGWKSVSVYDIAAGLRDKLAGGRPQVGHRSAIDAQIATHAVVYDTASRRLYVSLGPSLSGEFRGFDVAASLERGAPVEAGLIPADGAVPPAAYPRIKTDLAAYAELLNRKGNQQCAQAGETARGLAPRTEHYLKHLALGLLWKTCGAPDKARPELEAALSLSPAYARERRLAEKLLAK